MAGAPRVPATRKPKPKNPPKTYTSWKSVLFNGRSFTYNNDSFWKTGPQWSLGRTKEHGGHHTGVDISRGITRGTPVHTPMGGTVVRSDRSPAYGNNVMIQMKDGNYIFFAHLDSTAGLQPGTTVKAGTFVGRVGDTGARGSVHLHLEIRTKASGGRFGAGAFLNPIDYLNGKHPKIPTEDVKGSKPGDPKGGGGGGGGGGDTGGGTGNGGIGGVGGFTKKDYYRWLDAKFGSLKVLRELDAAARKEVGGNSIDWLIDTLAKEKITDESIVASYMNQTGWFKKYGAEASLRLVAEKQRPGVFADMVKKQTSTIKAQMDALGFSLSAKAMNQLARDSYVFGWDTAQVLDEAQKAFAQSGDVTYDGGAIGQAQDDLEEAAWNLGVNVTQQDIASMRQDVIDGKGYQSQLDDLRKRSAQMYTIYSDQILAGQSLRSVAGAYFQKAADLLELGSPDQVEMNDPLFSGGRAFMAPDPTTGKMTEKGLWEFEKDVKKDARWLETKNARDTTFETARSVLQLMGLI